jgi:hypothetical protein
VCEGRASCIGVVVRLGRNVWRSVLHRVIEGVYLCRFFREK